MILSELFESSEILTCESIKFPLPCNPVNAVSIGVEVALPRCAMALLVLLVSMLRPPLNLSTPWTLLVLEDGVSEEC